MALTSAFPDWSAVTFPSAGCASLPVSLVEKSHCHGVFNITSLTVLGGLQEGDLALSFDQALAQRSNILDLKGQISNRSKYKHTRMHFCVSLHESMITTLH